MDLEIILALAAFLVLVALFLIVLRRASQSLGETRQTVAFRHDVADIHERVDGELAALAAFVGPLRTPVSDLPDSEDSTAVVATTQEAVVWARDRVRGLTPPLGLEDARTVFMDELARADEALRSLEHGFAILSTVPAEGRALEGRTAIKRGYLRIVHAREGLGAESRRVAAWRSAGEQGLIARRQARTDHRL